MIIRSIRLHQSLRCRSMLGTRVVVVAVLRGDDALKDDASIGALQPGDRFEYVQIYGDKNGVERPTWVTGDAEPWELGPAEGRWEKPIETTIVMEWTPPAAN